MAVISGFFNSVNHDRKYNATDFSKIFDGVIKDGVFATIGDSLIVKSAGGFKVNVGTGKAWFNHTWTNNDSILPLSLPLPEPIKNRIDAIILEVNTSDNVRGNSIKYVTGIPDSSPSRPYLVHNNSVNQYALAYIYRKGGSSSITQSDITNMIGSSDTPFVTGILKTLDATDITAQWEAQYNVLFDRMEKAIDAAASQTLLDGSVTTPKMANGSVTTPKLADGSVYGVKLKAAGSELGGIKADPATSEDNTLIRIGKDNKLRTHTEDFKTYNYIKSAKYSGRYNMPTFEFKATKKCVVFVGFQIHSISEQASCQAYHNGTMIQRSVMHFNSRDLSAFIFVAIAVNPGDTLVFEGYSDTAGEMHFVSTCTDNILWKYTEN